MERTVYLLIAFIALGVLIRLLNRYTRKKPQQTPTTQAPSQHKSLPADAFTDVDVQVHTPEALRPEGCCGQHAVCEKESLIAAKADIIYFDDEELDAYQGRSPESYTEQEIAAFEEVLLTLQEHETADWLKSLQVRGIELPETIREQALLIVSERRANYQG